MCVCVCVEVWVWLECIYSQTGELSVLLQREEFADARSLLPGNYSISFQETFLANIIWTLVRATGMNVLNLGCFLSLDFVLAIWQGGGYSSYPPQGDCGSRAHVHILLPEASDSGEV